MAKSVVVTSALDALGKYNPADAYDAIGGITGKMEPAQTMAKTGKCYTKWIIKNCAQKGNWGGNRRGAWVSRRTPALKKSRNRMHKKAGKAWARLCPFLAHFEAKMTPGQDYYVYRSIDGAMRRCINRPMCKLVMCKQPAIATTLSKPLAPYNGKPDDKVTPWWNAQQVVCVTGPDGKAYRFNVFVQCPPVWKASQSHSFSVFNNSI